MSFHPCTDSLTPHQTIKTHLFDKLLQDKMLIDKLKNGSLFILLYQGWEPQNFTEKTREQDTIENYYEILQMVFKEYGIPNNSIIPMGSNARGYEYESKYDFKYKKVHSIFDNFMEVESFLSLPDELTLDLNYSFDRTQVENEQVTKQLEHRIKNLQEESGVHKQSLEQLHNQQPQDKLYSRAFKMVELGADIEEVVRECDIPLAEAEMLISVHRNKTNPS